MMNRRNTWIFTVGLSAVLFYIFGGSAAVIRVSEPILSNDIEHGGINTGGTVDVPTGLVGSADVPMTDIPGRPLDPNEFQNAVASNPTHPPDVDYDPILTANLFQGDIVIPNMETLQYINSHSVNGGRPPFKNVITNEYNKWPNAEIPYTISSRFNNNERATIARAMNAFHKQTCIRFIPRKGHRDYIYLTGGGGCSSAVGRVGGQQTVTLGNGCVYDGIVIHELMHAAGFWHEQSRADRDNYIRIMWNNIQRGMEYNFEKYEWGFIQNLSVAYDVGSIMHYGPYAFAVDRSQPTIVSRNGLKIGQREQMSANDKTKLNRLYSCDGESSGGSVITTTTTTEAPVIPGDCHDSNEYCKYWHGQGECARNPDWMHKNCRKSCGQCESEKECRDDNVNCKQWAKENHCTISEFYMKAYCKLSCGLCSVSNCSDDNEYCSYWNGKGECDKNPEWMLKYCKKSCNVC